MNGSLLLLFMLIGPLAQVGEAPCEKTIKVSNPSAFERVEVVSVGVSGEQADKLAARGLVLTDEDGREIAYQLSGDKSTMLFVADVKAKGKKRYKLSAGVAAEPATIATGKVYPYRMDDIAWENDRIAFRAYGPASQRHGDKLFGYDIMTKRVAEPVIEARYLTHFDPEVNRRIDSLRRVDRKASQALRDSTSYHIDHGNGMDCYAVGPTLGAGASALLVGDSIAYPWCYETCEILENGPVRFSVRMRFAPTNIGGRSVTEERVVTLDAHSQLCHTVVKYVGASAGTRFVAGPVTHDNANERVADAKRGIVAYADPTEHADGSCGTIFVGAVFAKPLVETKFEALPAAVTKRSGATGHVLGVGELGEDLTLDYYWGAGWTKWGFADMKAWEEYLVRQRECVLNPLKVK